MTILPPARSLRAPFPPPRMYQTLTAVGALAIAMTFALTSQRAQIRVDAQKTQTEVETLAGHVATDIIGHINIQEFDEQTTGRTVSSPNELTPAILFPRDLDCWGEYGAADACDDVDDFHKMRTHRVPVMGGAMTFDVEASVRYVNTAGQPDTRQTYQKELTVTVIDTPQNGRSVLPAPIEMSEIITWP